MTGSVAFDGQVIPPGGLPRGLTAEKALSGCSNIRNKALAEALAYMRYVEGWGSGFLRVWHPWGLTPWKGCIYNFIGFDGREHLGGNW